MDRKDFLKLGGLAGVATIAGAAGLSANAIVNVNANASEDSNVASPSLQGGVVCALIPSETAGPFPLDLSEDASKFRQDVREDQEGMITRLKMKIVSSIDCQPIANARVDIWHCNAHGYYSGYPTTVRNVTQDHTGATFLRGIQMTDAMGEVNFITIFPGWYPGRTVHIHFQVFLSSVLAATSQLLWPTADANVILVEFPPYNQHGADPTPPSSDGVFSNGYALQVATLTQNQTEGGYDSFLQVAINAQSTGLRNLEPETGGQFKLAQNFPNPYVNETVVPFTLARSSDVILDIFDVAGRKVTSVQQKNMPPGPQTLTVSLGSLGLADASYVYQLTVSNDAGEFRQCKVMTRVRD